LPALVHEVLESFRPLGHTKRQELEAMIEPGLPPIKADRDSNPASADQPAR
jgi:hypothetical protein